MCGRFTQKLTWHQIHDLYNLTAPTVPLNLQPRYNGAPGQEFAACRLDGDGNRTMVQLRWGLVPSWARDVRGIRLINARTETIHTKPSFSAAFRSRRCLVPADCLGCPFHKLELHEIGELPATRMLWSSSCRTF